ncbi:MULTISPECIES: hypothetical protein [Gammaproteobacteria]|uniref:Uncharacterized protein n=1 Tax=Aeromonas caviae TaxID=648 RepID=A0AA42UIQ9_AERCA|nr:MULTISPECIES: hypothetical protein [Gammaproteobacteria]UTA15080.1 hypothetical protein J3S84_00460 [Enterobacter cloacae]ELB2792614.1 hypothetical protein [Aeromonas hydrophila]MBS2782572.1 hypothetical protein [Aeromonas salmonicida]MDH1507267.1 hypothetical protein [Aeromonas caviae]MDH1807122.1 hypothetical protein [Aeromonas caviae]
MIKKILKITGVAMPFVIHFIIMSAILVLVLVNIKYGLEFDLIGTEYSRLVNGVYDMIYFLYFGSVISFAALYFSYLLVVRWVENRKTKYSNMGGNK